MVTRSSCPIARFGTRWPTSCSRARKGIASTLLPQWP
jgi:hypothetical protein